MFHATHLLLLVDNMCKYEMDPASLVLPLWSAHVLMANDVHYFIYIYLYIYIIYIYILHHRPQTRVLKHTSLDSPEDIAI